MGIHSCHSQHNEEALAYTNIWKSILWDCRQEDFFSLPDSGVVKSLKLPLIGVPWKAFLILVKKCGFHKKKKFIHNLSITLCVLNSYLVVILTVKWVARGVWVSWWVVLTVKFHTVNSCTVSSSLHHMDELVSCISCQVQH